MRWKHRHHGVRPGWAAVVVLCLLASLCTRGFLVHCSTGDGQAAVKTVFHAFESCHCEAHATEGERPQHVRSHRCDDTPLDEDAARLCAGGASGESDGELLLPAPIAGARTVSVPSPWEAARPPHAPPPYPRSALLQLATVILRT